MQNTAIWTTECDPRVADLRARLDAFYNDPSVTYNAFTASPSHNGPWAVIAAAIRERLASRATSQPLKVLEFGAGRTLFGEFLGPLRNEIALTVQDVTSVNETHLRQQADSVHIGAIESLGGSYEVIFSTYVWEHISTPRQTLDNLLERLMPGGSLFLFCPRYDIPGYVPPALRHHSRLRGLGLSLRLFLSRLYARVRRRPQFFIVTDPALFHGAWYRDADAVHLVSRYDLVAYLEDRGVSVRDCWPEQPTLARSLQHRLLKLCVELRKSREVDGQVCTAALL